MAVDERTGDISVPPIRRRMPSMADVAAMAGVSSQTVSRVANNRTNVDEQTRQRVISAMRALGYRPNTAARALVTGHFRTIGVIGFGLGGGNGRTVEAIAAAAQQAGYSTSFVLAGAQTERAVSEAFGRLSAQAADGIVLIEAQILDAPALHLPPGLPVVVADGDRNHRYHTVDTNQAAGARTATQHLLDLGHRTVWHIAGPDNSYAARHRAEAWHATLKAAGAPIPPAIFGDWSSGSGYQAGQRLAADPKVTAIFAANDQMALGAIRALHEAGRAVPRDVSIVGFDNVDDSPYFLPPLTTVQQDFGEVGRQCVDFLLAQMRDQNPPKAAQVTPELIIRSSTAAPPG